MSQNPEKRNKDSKEAVEDSIEQSIDNEDVEVAGIEEAKRTDITGAGL
ncbi:MAG: hypothetical protein ACJ72T_05625 [Nitrososphaeraceae archaeon]